MGKSLTLFPMRFFLVFSIVSALWAVGSLWAGSGWQFAGNAKAGEMSLITKAAKREKAEALNDLFDELQRQAKPGQARRTSRLIWQRWTESGSDTIDLLMDRVSTAMQDKNHQVALDLMDQIISLAPDYAEVWNRRATLYYTMDRFGRSISDIEQTLKLEPRHFGALSGLAVILQRLGNDEKALETWYRVLEIYPANEQAQEAVIKLEDKLSGRPT